MGKKTNQNKDDFLQRIKVDPNYKNMEYEKKKFMESFKKNPELIEYLSGDRLEYVLQYYLKENERLRQAIKKAEEEG